MSISSETILFQKIRRLPDEMINEIFQYIPNHVISWTSRENYIKYHYLTKYKLTIEYDTYMRNIIRKNFYFVFSRNLEENFEKWIMPKKTLYKKNIYSCYLSFIWDICNEYESTSCKNTIIYYMNSKPNYQVKLNDNAENIYKKKTKKNLWRN